MQYYSYALVTQCGLCFGKNMVWCLALLIRKQEHGFRFNGFLNNAHNVQKRTHWISSAYTFLYFKFFQLFLSCSLYLSFSLSLSLFHSLSLVLFTSLSYIHISCLNGIFTSAIQTVPKIYLLSSWSNPLYRFLV